ncbi:Smr/MutS family protein [Kaistella antarctica]|uniref:DNA mismatch repair protein n=1 Tax=Kaistella antarctica TaxID=266748 RepID=A0A3S4W4I8_9FLAO|nr:Smr/MutS family protein [Kaistella antarctica]KEY18762.1 DNA mismatch repair protein [Kaistella antarctica]SEW15724.1 Smr domain-containing protein [Kaistella antarctica]VEH99561.1 recombination and DNA strand exchange inhibitor protein [Kaistella antarctica]
MKIGDSVSVIDEQLKGTVISIKGKKVTIEDEHGFPYEYDATELVVQQAEIYEQIKTVRKEELAKPISKKHDKKPFVLDLHFEKLVKNTSDYNSFERLFRQKEKLITTIDYCRKNNLKKLEIIHGIGDGVLQQMVHDVLESQTNIEFQNKEILHHQSGTVLVYFR